MNDVWGVVVFSSIEWGRIMSALGDILDNKAAMSSWRRSARRRNRHHGLERQ
ncbi:hypothetical protein PAMC26510_32440 [Caballeronia sordidicola]|uniref:Uncharacterized protein n=1 Tax=Caballeronia sordidicola TaxID=196367 RepID=A0A242M7B8_CABSO|nr:hypothetical protein PAMC26510_32440 [Caballeronia sordidicola]